MAWQFSPEWLSAVVATAGTLGLAGWLLYLDPKKPANRAFAIFLFLRAAVLALSVLRGMSTTPGEVDYFNRIMPYFGIPAIAALLYFLTEYPKPRGAAGRGIINAVVFFGIAGAGIVAYMVDHALFATIEPGTPASALEAAGPGMRYTDFGPLILFSGLLAPAVAAASVVFALDVLRMPPGSARFSGYLVLAGFFLNSIFDASIRVLFAAPLLSSGAEFPWLPWGWAFAALPLLTVVPLLATIVILIVGLRKADAAARRAIVRILVAAPLPLISVIYASFWAPGGLSPAGYWGPTLLGLWRLALPILVTYALVRYQLFDIDIRIRWTIKGAAVVGIFFVTITVTAETAEGLIADFAGSYAALAAALILALLFRPLENLADRLARRAMPNAHPIDGLPRGARLALYQDQIALAAQDGMLTARERRMLDALRDRLGLSTRETARLDRGVAVGTPS